MIEILIFGLIILAATSLWVLIEKRRNPKFLMWFIPVLLILVTSTYITYTSILGLPKFEIPKKKKNPKKISFFISRIFQNISSPNSNSKPSFPSGTIAKILGF